MEKKSSVKVFSIKCGNEKILSELPVCSVVGTSCVTSIAASLLSCVPFNGGNWKNKLRISKLYQIAMTKIKSNIYFLFNVLFLKGQI